MRVLAVTNMYPSAASPGSGVFVHEQIKGLRAIGLNTRVLFVDRRKKGALEYYRMGHAVADAVAEFDPDVIHVMYGGVMAAQVVGRHHSRPVIVTFHGSDLLGENLSGWVRKIISRYGVYCSRKTAKAADRVIVVAHHLVRALKGTIPPHKIRMIPCGIDLDRFTPTDPLWCKQQLNWNPRSFHVLFASSNGDPVKRPGLARAAMAQMDGEFHYMTGISNAEVPLWLNAADALLLTSLHEGSPTIVKEALACGLPIVSVNVGDVSERIQGIEGCYLANADPADLASKLSLVRKSGKRLDCRSRLEELSIITIAQRLKRCYEEVTTARDALDAPVATPAQMPA